jgi:hypothetical protein
VLIGLGPDHEAAGRLRRRLARAEPARPPQTSMIEIVFRGTQRGVIRTVEIEVTAPAQDRTTVLSTPRMWTTGRRHPPAR